MQLDLEILNLFIKVDDFSIKDLREILDLLGLEVKHIDGKILTIETLANRGDHLSHVNIAKELALALGLEVRPVKVGTRLDFFEPSKSPSLLIDNISELTLSFAICHIRCKPFKNHKVKLKTARRDFNFKNPLVTISNYVTTEIGQPLHCYSAKKVKPPFYTKQTEICRFQALDGQIYSFPEHTITVFDSTNRPVAIGGIIGSYDSCLDDDDWEIYLESACFDPVQIRKSRTAAGINTEASFYFERGVAFDIQKIAIERFLEILEENYIDFEVLAFEMKNKRINSRKILLNKEIISKHLGFPVEPRDCSRILSELDFKILSEDNIGFEVEVPPKRYFNVFIQEDLVQDLARFIGFNKIPKSCLKFEVSPPSVNPLFDCSNRLRHFAICHGFHEVMTRVFISPKERDTLSQLNKDDT
ncbi:MAG: phenylalanine--tRNA ligase beta subunit-related protein, partial [Deltaproteobacteria bacterium]|nr:phenylalanine--tRNA ligase beta subunit-related protein [Deltaproteobacteria bacterium]